MSPDFEVVILNDHASVTGGSSSVAVASALGLAARGIRVTYFSAVGPVAPALLAAEGVEVVCLGQEEIAKNSNRLQAFASGWKNGGAVRALRELLARKSTARTIVHAHGWMKALSPFVLCTAARMGFPLVVTLHDFFIACPNGGFFVYGRNTLCGLKPLSAACWRCNCDRRNYGHKLWRNARTLVQNKLLGVPQQVAHFIAVSDFSLNILRPHLPPDARATVVRNPVECARTKPSRVGTNREFVYVGRLEIEKGVRLFAEAVRLAGVPAKFVGDGALSAELRQICPDAQFTGWLGPEAIRRELQSARALVFPPLWYETLGLVVIEAAASGVPAIIADRCAATDHIRDGVNGRHFAHGSVESLANLLTQLAADDAQVARLGAAAHEWYWRAPWTAERHVDELLDVYQKIAAVPVAQTNGRNAYASAGGLGTGSGRSLSLRGDAVPLPE